MAGNNCENGGIKIEVGLDDNGNGILDDDEIDNTQTRYICNGNNGEAGSAGLGSMTGENLVPEAVVLLEPLTPYVIPQGKYAKISNVFRYDSGAGQQSYIYQNVMKLDLILSNGLTDRVIIDETDHQYAWKSVLNGPIYFPEGTTLSLPDTWQRELPIEIYSIGNFHPKVITENYTVPAGKKIKVSNIIPDEGLNSNKLSQNGHSIEINNEFVLIGGGDCIGCQPNPRKINNLLNNPFWLGEGNTIAPAANVFGISILEFNSNQSSEGFGGEGTTDNNGPGFSGYTSNINVLRDVNDDSDPIAADLQGLTSINGVTGPSAASQTRPTEVIHTYEDVNASTFLLDFCPVDPDYFSNTTLGSLYYPVTQNSLLDNQCWGESVNLVLYDEYDQVINFSYEFNFQNFQYSGSVSSTNQYGHQGVNTVYGTSNQLDIAGTYHQYNGGMRMVTQNFRIFAEQNVHKIVLIFGTANGTFSSNNVPCTDWEYYQEADSSKFSGWINYSLVSFN